MTKIKTITKSIESSQGNYKSYGNVYISPDNMKSFATYLTGCEDIQEILITPYLLNLESDGVCELIYYEFTLEVLEIPKSYFIEYPIGNTLPKEIVENIKPKVVIAKKDKKFPTSALLNYLECMDKMSLNEVRNADDRLKEAKLCYQIF